MKSLPFLEKTVLREDLNPKNLKNETKTQNGGKCTRATHKPRTLVDLKHHPFFFKFSRIVPHSRGVKETGQKNVWNKKEHQPIIRSRVDVDKGNAYFKLRCPLKIYSLKLLGLSEEDTKLFVFLSWWFLLTCNLVGVGQKHLVKSCCHVLFFFYIFTDGVGGYWDRRRSWNAEKD